MSSQESPPALHPPGEDAAALRWRIPHGGPRSSLRYALLQIAFAAVVVGLLVVFLAPPDSSRNLLLASMAIAGVLAVLQGMRHWRQAQGPANVWLDHAGLHWYDAGHRQQTLPRSAAHSFYLGADAQTHRPRASLTLLLDEGFLSQPIELHPPADEARVRQWLGSRWSLREVNELPTAERVTLPLVSLRDTQEQRWYLEGSLTQLRQLADKWSELAKTPPPPVGARPRQIDLHLGDDALQLAIGPHTWVESQLFAVSPHVLAELAAQLHTHLRALAPSSDQPSPSDAPFPEFEIPLVADTGHHWRLVFNENEVE